MTINSDVSDRQIAALRIALGSGGTLLLLLIVLMLVRPDMAMSAMHHVEAMIGMTDGVSR